MNCCALFLNSTLFPITINIKSVTFKNQSFFLRQSSVVSANLSTITKHKSLSSVHSNSLRVLEWDKLCDSVSSFATTSFGREATKVSLSLKLCFKFSMNVSSLFLFLFSLCVRHSCGLWIKRTKRVWGFWKRPMRPWKCTTMVVVDWTLPALMLFLLVHCS